MNSQREAFESIIKIAFDGVGGNKADHSLMDIRSIAIDQLEKLSANCKPVAWRHDDPDRVDVIEDCVKQLLIDCSPSDPRKGIQRPIDKVEHYTIPLYTRQAATEQGVGEAAGIRSIHGFTVEDYWAKFADAWQYTLRDTISGDAIAPLTAHQAGRMKLALAHPCPPKPTGGGVPECFQYLYEHAKGLVSGTDWNNGTAAKHHRLRLIDAVGGCATYLATQQPPEQE